MRLFLILSFFLIQNECFYAQTERCASILIGNAGYVSPDNILRFKFDPLAYPVNDVIKMYSTIKKLGVESDQGLLNIRSKNAFETNIVAARKSFLQDSITKVIFYYSGHGLEERNRTFLIPTNFKFIFNVQSIYPNASKYAQQYFEFIQAYSFNFTEEKQGLDLRYVNLIENAVDISMIADNLKTFNLLIISDACRNKLPKIKHMSSFENEQPLISKEYIKEWNDRLVMFTSIKKPIIPLMSLSEAEQYAIEIRTIMNLIQEKIDIFENNYRRFESTLTDSTTRKPVTILLATSIDKKAKESWDTRGAVFTQAMTSIIDKSNSNFFRFDEDLVKLIEAEIQKESPAFTQIPVLRGSNNFVLKVFSN